MPLKKKNSLVNTKRIKKITFAEGNLLEPYWESYVEMKATRDTGMHGGWIVNRMYIENDKNSPSQKTIDYLKIILKK